ATPTTTTTSRAAERTTRRCTPWLTRSALTGSSPTLGRAASPPPRPTEPTTGSTWSSPHLKTGIATAEIGRDARERVGQMHHVAWGALANRLARVVTER